MAYVKLLVLTLFFVTNLSSKELILTFAEQKYLFDKKELKFCIDPNWMPYEFYKDGEYLGFAADYMKIIEKKLDIPLVLVNSKSWTESLSLGKKRACDFHTIIGKNEEREKYLNFSKPYFYTSLVLTTTLNEVFIDNIKALKNKKIGVVKDYYYISFLEENYPNLELIKVNNIKEGLSLVKEKKLFALVETLYSVGYHIQNNYVGQLKIAGKFDKKIPLYIASRNDEVLLSSIFNKVLDSISLEKKQKILNSWLSIKYEKTYNKELFAALVFAFIIILLILYINIKLRLENKKRKELENLLELTIKGANLGTWRWYPQSNINIINNKWADILGFTKKEIDENYNDFRQLVHPHDLNIIEQALNKHLNGNSSFYQCEFRMKTKDGLYKWIYSNGAVVKKDNNNQALMVSGIHQDINNRKKLQEENLKQKDLMVQQSRQAAMGEMLENIAHQWRQPLSLISISSSSVSLAKEMNRLDDEFLIKAMDNITETATYLSQTIDDFRDFFKKDKPKNSFNIKEVINNSIKFFSSKIENRSIDLILSLEDNEIESYENELIQCFLNIINNTIDALDLNEKKLEKKLIFIDSYKKDDKIVIEIKDNALGIKKEILNRIFEPYFTTKHKSQGTGIGLYMTKEIVCKHAKGEILAQNCKFSYKNKEYLGARFVISLPLKF